MPAEFAAWLPVTAEERALTAPVVEKDSGAQILMWRVHVVDEHTPDLRGVFHHYIRLKIFDEKGKAKAATIDLTYQEPGAILHFAGRTIKPDGSVVNLDSKAVYKRDPVHDQTIRGSRKPIAAI